MEAVKIINHRNMTCYKIFESTDFGFTIFQERTDIVLTEEQSLLMAELLLGNASRINGVTKYSVKKKKLTKTEVVEVDGAGDEVSAEVKYVE